MRIVETERNWKDRIGAIGEIFVNSRARSASGKGAGEYTSKNEFFSEESLFFTWEESKVWRAKNDWSPLPLVGSVPIFCHAGFKGASIDPCKIHGNSSTGSFHDTFRTGRGTSSMILGDLRSPNRSQIAFALVLMAGARVSRSTLDAYSIPSCRSFDIIQMERAVPFPYYYRVIIIVWKLFQIRVYKSFEIYRTFKQVYERNRKFLSFRVLTKYLREFSKIISNL